MSLNSTAQVSVAQVDSYRPAPLRLGLEALLQRLGGIKQFVSRGDRILLKPNFLSAKSVDAAVCTHPELIVAVAEACLEAGARSVAVGDSPAVGAGRGVARRMGLKEPLAQLGVPLLDFQAPVEFSNNQSIRFKRLELERSVLEADKVINLAKVKTHMQMFLTLAVKNTFGYVVGTRKASWHLEAGRDLEMFATLMVDIHHARLPQLNILDGIVMMEGNGPGNGIPRNLGVLMASTDAHALDRFTCDVLSLPVEQCPITTVAAKANLGTTQLDRIEIVGASLEEIRITDVAHPKLVAANYSGAPELLQRLARRLLEVRPTVVKDKCIGCRLCDKQCPAEAISMVPVSPKGEIARIDYSTCIHCYCCQEICPEGAIEPKRGLVRRLMRPLRLD